MSDVIIAVVSLILGVGGSVLASKYYFQRSVDKALTPYLQFSTSLFTGAQRRMREDLKIAYRGTPVQDLTETQFLIANTGERAIKDVLKPLTLHIPEGSTVLEVSILHIDPEGREVTVSRAAGHVEFDFQLLNSGEFFITKILLSGEAAWKDFHFSISAEDLPPILKPQFFHPGLIEEDSKVRFHWGSVALSMALLAVGAAVARLIYETAPIWKNAAQGEFFAELTQHRWIVAAAILAIAPALLSLIAGTMLLFEELFSLTRFRIRRRRRFRIPHGPGRTFQHGPILRVSLDNRHAIQGHLSARE